MCVAVDIHIQWHVAVPPVGTAFESLCHGLGSFDAPSRCCPARSERMIEKSHPLHTPPEMGDKYPL
jgi:hypothetical protein